MMNYQANSTSDTTEAWVVKNRLKLKELAKLQPDWHGGGADPPNSKAIKLANIGINCLKALDFPPTLISPSIMGGIGISFVFKGGYADIECFNEDGIVAVIAGRNNKPIVWDVTEDSDSHDTKMIMEALEKMRNHILQK